jgi:quinohemoprotein ethanol dehydrogenase
MSFSPQTGLVYFPAVELPWIHSPANFYLFDYEVPDIESLTSGLPAIEQGGYLKAWDPVKRELMWQIKHDTSTNGGVLSTAGNLVFQGTEDGFLRAYRATDGALLHKLFIGSSIIAPPITYRVDGVQYVTVMAGFGGAMMGIVDEQSAARDFENTGRVLSFRLDGYDVPLPPTKATEEVTVAEREPVSPDVLARGQQLYKINCGFCHGMSGSVPILPDLRYMTRQIESLLPEIVLGGLFVQKGMPTFAGVLSEDDLDAIHAAINHEAMEMKRTTSLESHARL